MDLPGDLVELEVVAGNGPASEEVLDIDVERERAAAEVVEDAPRGPSPELQASIQIIGDLLAPVITPEEWEALR